MEIEKLQNPLAPLIKELQGTFPETHFEETWPESLEKLPLPYAIFRFDRQEDKSFGGGNKHLGIDPETKLHISSIGELYDFYNLLYFYKVGTPERKIVNRMRAFFNRDFSKSGSKGNIEIKTGDRAWEWARYAVSLPQDSTSEKGWREGERKLRFKIRITQQDIVTFKGATFEKVTIDSAIGEKVNAD